MSEMSGMNTKEVERAKFAEVMAKMKPKKIKSKKYMVPELYDRRPFVRKSLKIALKGIDKKEEMAARWTYMKCQKAFETFGIAGVIKYKNDVKKCNGRTETISRIDKFIETSIKAYEKAE